ncbi:MAG: Unknown protein [uncultured Sulfurovum sp.]|uniref:Uncharacterized protein n=1 Tax=uncultured Sulfurovum sp. TaxID=269237 RepID=A0A6S6TBP9_9BACT|nr:MAG: Unknown protein [uncultured Sulfurovum sp.]
MLDFGYENEEGFMLYQYTNEENKVFNLAPHNDFTIESENIFTTIVGQNGTGKSRLLKSILEDLIVDNDTRIKASSTHYNMVAISPSPYDKFPMPKYTNGNYTYLGLRGLKSDDMSASYLSKIVFLLINKFHDDTFNVNELMSILDYLDYKKKISFKFKIIGRDFLKSIGKVDSLKFNKIDSFWLGFVQEKYVKYFFNNNLEVKNEEDLEVLLRLSNLISYEERLKKPTLSILNGVFSVGSNTSFTVEDILFMLNFELLKLEDVSLYKKGLNKKLLMSEASSGEQSIIMSMLGIASKIKDGSLICIST